MYNPRERNKDYMDLTGGKVSLTFISDMINDITVTILSSY